MLDVKILGDLEMDDVNTKLCVDEFYPKENLELANEIIKRGGRK